MWKRYWFVVALAFAVMAGFIWPDGGVRMRQSPALFSALVAITLLISGFSLDTARLLGQAANFRIILLGIGTTYGVAPLFAYGLALLWGPENTGPDSEGFFFLQSVMIAAAQAGTIASAIALTVVARGDQELALVLTLATNGLTAVLTPLVLKLSIGRVVDIPIGDMVIKMFVVLLGPVLAGQLLRRFLWEVAKPIRKSMRLVPQLIILIFVYGAFGAASEHLTQHVGLAFRFLGTCFCLHLSLLFWTYGVTSSMRLPPEARTAVVFCGSQKTLPNAIYVWQKFFATNPYGAVAITVYHVLQLIVDTFLTLLIAGRQRASKQ